MTRTRILPIPMGSGVPSGGYATSISVTMDENYVLSVQLLNQDGDPLGDEQTVDLPLESVVVSGSYDSVNKQLILTLDNGNTIEIPISDLISGLQAEITAQNPLSADYLTDGSTNKVFTSTEQTKLSNIEAGAQVNVKPDWNAASGSAAEILNKPTIPAAQVNSDWNAVSGAAEILNKPSIPDAVSGVNDGTNWTSITIGSTTAAIPQGGSATKIELMNLTPVEQYQFYMDAMDRTIKDFSNYTANGYQIINAYPANTGWEIGSVTPAYTTDGSELVLLMNPMLYCDNTSNTYTDLFIEYYTTLFSPTIVSTYGATIDIAVTDYSNVKSDWNASSGDINGILNKPTTVAMVVTFTDQTTATYNLYHS